MSDLQKVTRGLDKETGLQVIGGVFREWEELQEKISKLAVPEALNTEEARRMIWDAYNELKYSLFDKRDKVEVAYDAEKKLIRLGIFNYDSKGDFGHGRSTHEVITIGSELYNGQIYLCKKKTVERIIYNPWENRDEVTVYGCFEIFENDGNKVGERIYNEEFSRISNRLRRAGYNEILDLIHVKDLMNPIDTMFMYNCARGSGVDTINASSTTYLNRVLFPQNGVFITTERKEVIKGKKPKESNSQELQQYQPQKYDSPPSYEKKEMFRQYLSCSDWDDPKNFDGASFSAKQRRATLDLITLEFKGDDDKSYTTMQEAAEYWINEYHNYLKETHHR